MRRQRLLLACVLAISIVAICACGKYETKKPQLKENSQMLSLKLLTIKTKEFLKDTKMPSDIYETFVMTLLGDEKAKEWLLNYNKETEYKFDSIIYGVIGDTYSKENCLYNIGMLYYNGNKEISLEKNDKNALFWLKQSVYKGSFDGAILLGDMEKGKDALLFYEKALNIKTSGIAYERIANCYENGIGTDKDEEKANNYYFKSTLDGNSKGLYKMAQLNSLSAEKSILFLKAAGSMDYSAPYFTMVYEGLDGYSPSDSKKNGINRLEDLWNHGGDSTVDQLKKSITENEYFSKKFVEELIKTSYTYSYHTFAEKHSVGTTDFADGDEDIQELNYGEWDFYDLDFDGDGKKEVGLPDLSGAGGAFMTDGIGIYKKNKDGVYEEYAYGPSCTLRDAMQVIQYENGIYFITNPFSDTKNDPHNITARAIDNNGNGHTVSVICNKYKPKEVMTQVYGDHADELKTFLSRVQSQALEAIDMTKKHQMYNPNRYKEVLEDEYAPNSKHIYFASDIDNDGVKEYVLKAHEIDDGGKYYQDYNLFQIFQRESELENAESVMDSMRKDSYYGLHSSGNIYDMLPVSGKIVQFWTQKEDDITYCIALTRNELLYGLHVFMVKDEKALPICESLLFDEVQGVDVVFSQD